MEFRNYTPDDYEAVCDFLIALNRNDCCHINWNWARFEWMAEHPEFDKTAMSSIGLWREESKIVGAAIYDMYFGEGFCGTLPEYAQRYPEILDYACKELRDNAGFGLAICDDNEAEIDAAKKCGFVRSKQEETVMKRELDKPLPAMLPEGFRFVTLDPAAKAYSFQWLLWQGFDHGTDKAEFERAEPIVPQNRRHLNKNLSVAVIDPSGENAAYCCVWHHEHTDYAYVEPVCTVPAHRGKGLAVAAVSEALNRARKLGAKRAYVISDLSFYEKLGFMKSKHYSFYWRK